MKLRMIDFHNKALILGSLNNMLVYIIIFFILGDFPIDGQNIMTPQQKAQFLPAIKQLIKVLQQGNNPNELEKLLQLSRDLNRLIPSEISGLSDLDLSSGFSGLSGLQGLPGLSEY